MGLQRHAKLTHIGMKTNVICVVVSAKNSGANIVGTKNRAAITHAIVAPTIIARLMILHDRTFSAS
jgi:hypothetical protein